MIHREGAWRKKRKALGEGIAHKKLPASLRYFYGKKEV